MLYWWGMRCSNTGCNSKIRQIRSIGRMDHHQRRSPERTCDHTYHRLGNRRSCIQLDDPSWGRTLQMSPSVFDVSWTKGGQPWAVPHDNQLSWEYFLWDTHLLGWLLGGSRVAIICPDQLSPVCFLGLEMASKNQTLITFKNDETHVVLMRYALFQHRLQLKDPPNTVNRAHGPPPAT